MSDLTSAKIVKANAGSFQGLGLSPEVLRGVMSMGYKIPTPVQRKSLPIALAGMDIVCMARTGSGKTLAFLIPLIQRLQAHENIGIRGIVLSPTRELAVQTLRFASDLAKYTSLRVVSIVGGDGIEAQFEQLSNNPDILIASPGRLSHHLNEISTLKLKAVQYLVFDEADRLFEMGFAEQINDIIRQCPIERQTLLFSATMPKMLIQFSRAGLRDPQLVRLDTDVKMSEELRLAFFMVRTHEKIGAFLYLVRQIIPSNQSTIIFTATKHHSEFLHMLMLHIGFKCSLIYGSMDQESRQENLKSFRLGEVNFLIVTDIAARGIDIPLINNVINFHFPATPKLFVHRCGRAARQGRLGYAFSIIEQDELPYAADVHRFLDTSINVGLKVKGCDDDICDASESTHEVRLPNLVEYGFETMQPSQIHTGLLPQDVLDEEVEYVKSVLTDHDEIMTLLRVSDNAMKQYKRTRTAASHHGVKSAKKLIKEETIRFIHPLIRGTDPKRCSSSFVEKASFIRMLQTFRPLQTVLETGIGTGSAAGAKKKAKSEGTDNGVDVMKALRSANGAYLERNRIKLSVADLYQQPDDGVSHISDNDSDVPDEFLDDQFMDDFNGSIGGDSLIGGESVMSNVVKPRVSVTERRKLKRKGYSISQIQEYAWQKLRAKIPSSSIDITDATLFRDPKHYMTYGTEDERAMYAEESLQPKSGLRSGETQSANMLENAMLDLSGSSDDVLEMNKNRKITHWDEKKRKFVKQTLNEMASAGRKGVKRLRSESGVSSTSKRAKGELYEKWKKRSHREIGVYSDIEDPYDNKPTPKVNVNPNVKDEIKGQDELRKMYKIRDKNKLKNMTKEKREGVRKTMKRKATGPVGSLASRSGKAASSRTFSSKKVFSKSVSSPESRSKMKNRSKRNGK